MFVIVIGKISIIRNVQLQGIFGLRGATSRIELETQPFDLFWKFNSDEK